MHYGQSNGKVANSRASRIAHWYRAVRAPGADAARVVAGAGASVAVASRPSAVTAARSGAWGASTPW